LKFSIIIPNYNGAALLPPCLDSLQAQTYSDFEVILVDNASGDGSVELVQRDYPQVRLLALERNRGLTGGCNEGIAQARGEIIVCLNNDTEADPGWLSAIVGALAAYPQAGMVACKLLLFDRRDTIHSAGDSYGLDGIPVNRGVWQPDGPPFDKPAWVFGACGGAAAYRWEMLEQIGLPAPGAQTQVFDEELFMYCEDVDLNWRAQLAGYRCLYVPGALVYHRLSATGGGPLASFYVGRNTIWVTAKNYPAGLWRKYWPRIVSAQLRIARQALSAWRGTAARARLRGQIAGLRGLSRWLGKRAVVRRAPQVGDDYLEGLMAAALSPRPTALALNTDVG
jgi:GT2 family glycosyltransferase